MENPWKTLRNKVFVPLLVGKDITNLKEELTRIKSHLVICGAVASGKATPGELSILTPDDLGWNQAYQDISDLRRRYDKLDAKISTLTRQRGCYIRALVKIGNNASNSKLIARKALHGVEE